MLYYLSIYWSISTWKVTILDSYFESNNSWTISGLVPRMFLTGYDQHLRGGPSKAEQIYIFTLSQQPPNDDRTLQMLVLNQETAFLERLLAVDPQLYPMQRQLGMTGLNTNNSKGKSKSLEGWKIALIVVGGVVVVAGVVAGAIFWKKRRDRHHYQALH